MLDRRVRPARQGQRLGKSPGTDVSERCSCAVESAGAVWCAPRGTPDHWRDHRLMKRNLIAAAFTLTVLATAACGGDGAAVKPTASKPASSPMTTSPTSSPTATIDPKAKPAVDAYLAYVTASNIALRKPRGLGEAFAPGADYSKYSFDPAEGSLSAIILQLSSQILKMTGDPGKPRARVQSLELEAKPYPRVVLTDCPTPPARWHPTDAKTGKDVSAPLPSGVAAPPYQTKVVVIYYQGHWGVSQTTSDTSRTCSA
jgi:hypothetical protein